MKNKSTLFLILGAAAVGIAMLWRKVSGVSDLAQNVTFKPYINGIPSVKNWSLSVPVGVEISNPTSGRLSVEIKGGAAYVNGTELVTLSIPAAAKVDIAANGTSKLEGLNISAPITTLLQFISDNIYNVINGDLEQIKRLLSVRVDAVVGGTLNVSVTHSFADDATQNLGLVSNGRRSLKPFSDYSAYLPPRTELLRTDSIVIPGGSVEDTVRLMREVVRTTLSDTARLSRWLRRNTVRDTVESVWNFVYNYIQYERDSSLREQVRRPLRTLYDRAGDCDCYATLIGSILTNLDIPFRFRIAEYNNRGYYQHVYVIVPTERGYYTCDPVLDRCFEEKPPTRIKDF